MQGKHLTSTPIPKENGELKKLLRIMKLTVILLTAVFLQASAIGYSQKITFSGKDVSLEKIFSVIEKQTGYVVFYNYSALKEAKTVTINAKDVALQEFLEDCFADQPFKYVIEGKTILIARKNPPQTTSEEKQAIPPPIDVHGRLVNENGEPVAATVTVKGTNNATATDADGNFLLKNVDENATLVITGVNIETREMKLSPSVTLSLSKGEVLSITVKTKISSLNEVVVNKGYYTTTQKLNTGDVTKINGDDIRKQPVSDPILALEGRVPGLYISQTSGMPGAYSTIRLRGQNSIANGNDPLYVIDGVPFSSNSLTSSDIGGGAVGIPGLGQPGQGLSPFNSLNPADIESIEILKDADATTIYGSRGANGVILITTKKGKAGKTRFEINTYSGAGKVTRMMDLLNTQQYLQIRHQAFTNDGTLPSSTDYDINGRWDSTRFTNWEKTFIGGTSQYTNASASLSGGDLNTQFVINGTYSKQTTVFPGNYSDKKISAYLNLNHISLDQKFHGLLTVQYINDKNILPQADFTGNIFLAPDAPALYDANGNVNWQGNTWTNPIAATLKSAKAITNNLIGNLNLSYEIIPGLQLRSSLGYTRMEMNQTNQTPATSFPPPNNNNSALRRNSFATSYLNTFIIEPQISYDKKIGKGKLNIIVGSTIQQNSQGSLGQLARNFPSDVLISNVAAASSISILGNSLIDYHYSALFGRVSYNWQEKYLLNVTARRDGSSRFGPGKQFGNFGAIGTGWIFSKEKFIQTTLHFLSFGKIKASYGLAGNDQITDYQYLSSYSPYTTSTYQGTTTLQPNRIANPYFAWELNKKFETGIELGFLGDRIFFTANYYRNRTGNQLVAQRLPSIDGFTSIQANLPGVVQNTGIELALNTFNFKSQYFAWSTSFNLSIPRNKLESFPNLASNPTYNSYYSIGRSLFVKPLYHFTGLNPQTGIYTFQDVNGDGVMNSQDRQFMKEVKQQYFGGFQNSFSFKNWQLDLFVQFVKQTGYNYLSAYASGFNLPGLFNQNQPTLILDSWSKPGDNVPIEKFTTSFATLAGKGYSYMQISDAGVSNASFIRLKNIFLSYSLPLKWQASLHLKDSKIYLQTQNLFTITNFKGLDPEAQGITSLPPLRMIALGIKIGL